MASRRSVACWYKCGYTHHVATAPKNQRLAFRVDEHDAEKLTTAAMIRGDSLTEFVIGSALERANNVLAHTDVTWVSPGDYDEMVAVLSEPVAPISELVTLMSQPRIVKRA